MPDPYPLPVGTRVQVFNLTNTLYGEIRRHAFFAAGHWNYPIITDGGHQIIVQANVITVAELEDSTPSDSPYGGDVA